MLLKELGTILFLVYRSHWFWFLHLCSHGQNYICVWFFLSQVFVCRNMQSCVYFFTGIPYASIVLKIVKCYNLKKFHNFKHFKTFCFQDHPSAKKKRFHIQNSKKIGCQSKLTVRMCRVYYEYIADPSTLSERKMRKVCRPTTFKRSYVCSEIISFSVCILIS